ncbi:glycosyltransferase [Candidatus Woesearchaeota archaeon]|nr:glycosyltransferase [Candidatus Woesearchaeota archaeon]
MTKKNIIFFKDGQFPNISESHITNKIKNIKKFEKTIVCKRINPQNTEYLDKLKDAKIYYFKGILREDQLKTFSPRNIIKKILVSIFNYKESKPNNTTLKIYYNIEKIIFLISKIFKLNSRLRFYQNKIKELNPTVINGCYGWEIVPLSIIKDKNQKIILDIRGKDLTVLKKYKFIRQLTKKNATLLLTRSESMKKELINLGFKQNKINVNHSGCDLTLFEYQEIKNLDTLKIVTIGRLVEKKGHLTIIKACKKLKKKGIKFNAIFIGTGPMEEKIIKEIKKLNLKKEIKLVGNVQNNQIKKFIKKSNIFILPSEISKLGDQEGIPVALMEAMASGLICISTKHSGIPELIENNINGILISEKDHNELFKKLEEIKQLSKRKLNNITKNARQKIETQFNDKKQTQEFENIINKLNHQKK